MDTDVVKGNTRSISLTFSTEAGVPVAISTWTFYYKAVKVDDATVTITVANAAMTKSDSGRGVTDTVSIPLDNSVTAVAAGRYNQEIAVAISAEPTTIAMGTLNVVERVLTVV
jgi:hypothetical protein